MQIFRRSSSRGDASSGPAPDADDASVPSARCPELAAVAGESIPVPEPAAGEKLGCEGCEGCVAIGEDHWAHLRMCLRCGYIGCCDSSPRRHATAHFHDTSHPVMRSAEPGESWRWCYVHEVIG
ncbi:UBP-type zinc finger domain-containing protein [Gordonia alkanivorans]|uniref:UBP-type zinc finger domain-containing protein n=1 Tax=Gordonia alkanivorans TaxID=84096 RepID=UPI0024B72847|nr:UBP-type zinc finger domain-containing protein [Gordonia alkanivorans]MDJ0028774.1 UBP-type zinc finger domain-containing protein [Gordonia alkanivorans]